MSAQVNVASKAAVKIVVNAVSGGGGGGGVTAHSALTGLTTGDDHTQYLLSKTANVLSSSTTLSGAPRLFIVVGGSTFTMPATTPSSYLGRPWTFSNSSGSTVTLNAGTSGYLFNGTDQTIALRDGRQVEVTLLSVTGSGTLWGTGSLGPVPSAGGSIGVDDLIAGTNVTLTPSGDNQQVTISATGGTVNSVSGSAPLTSTGTSSVVLSIPAATTAVDGYMTSAQATKLAGVATGATANSSDATLLARANHTGTQAATTITGLAAVATTGAYTDLTGRPSLAAVATTGAYADLSGRPTLGGAAALNVGTAAGTVAAGDDSRLSDTRTPTDNSVTSAKIVDGTIVNADISASAAIATSKINGLATVATSGSASDLSTGTVASARLSTKAVGGQGAGSQVNEPSAATSLLTSTVTLPACAAGDVLIVDAGINFTQNSGASRNVTFAVKIGATTILSTTPAITASATSRQTHLHAVIRVLSTTSQSAEMTLVFNTASAGSTGVASAATGTAAETISSGSLALDVLVTATSNTTQNYTLTSLSVTKVAA